MVKLKNKPHFVVRILCGGPRESFILRDRKTKKKARFKTYPEASFAGATASVVEEMNWEYKVESRNGAQ